MQTLFEIHDQPIDKPYKEFKIAIDACGKFNIAETQNKSPQKSSKFSTSEQGAQEVQTEFVLVKVPKLWRNLGKIGRGKLCGRQIPQTLFQTQLKDLPSDRGRGNRTPDRP
jgi:hypothetical protein